MIAGMKQMPLLGAIKSTVELEQAEFQMAEASPFAALFSQVMEESGNGSNSVLPSQQNNTNAKDWIVHVLQILENGQNSEPVLEKQSESQDVSIEKQSNELQDEILKKIVLPTGTLQKALVMVSEALNKWLGSKMPDNEQNDSKKDPVEQLATVLEGIVALPIEQWKKLDPNVLLPLLKTAKQLTNLDGNAQLSPKEIESVRWIQELLSEISQKAETAAAETNQKQLAILKKAFSHYIQPQIVHGEKEPLEHEFVAKLGEKMKGIQPLNKHEELSFSSFQLNHAKTGGMISVPVQTDPKPMNLQQFIDKFRQVLEKSQFAKQPSANTLMIKLYPENLGTLRIELQQKEGIVTARILASAQTVKDLIDSNITSLKQAFTQQNIFVDKLEVVFHQPELDTYHGDSSEGGRREQQPPQKQKDNEKESDHSFEELLINMEV
ncbi:MAG: flagellar hook-length control protein FliK [Bacillales bacterium]|nr:flagellar hook-length control protein FliK [Bacillales bacterium]